MTTTALPRRKGRPIGAKTRPPVIVRLAKSRCPVCLSTDRTAYEDVKPRVATGTAPDGHPYNKSSSKKTRCRKCRQVRIDVIYEYAI